MKMDFIIATLCPQSKWNEFLKSNFMKKLNKT